MAEGKWSLIRGCPSIRPQSSLRAILRANAVKAEEEFFFRAFHRNIRHNASFAVIEKEKEIESCRTIFAWDAYVKRGAIDFAASNVLLLFLPHRITTSKTAIETTIPEVAEKFIVFLALRHLVLQLAILMGGIEGGGGAPVIGGVGLPYNIQRQSRNSLHAP
ncbi:hypothetical protein CEXT_550761 [Caerostris extrusa]|uniref:Uncharacterized protein n=1 Tax=Caerostris extrusa TaxID=172846 RepID=A0AAV4TVL4_CAEEX|nr:hypothetical protein CEXT_550761 [Caerostris extrusa]